jgi:hypothetical protein
MPDGDRFERVLRGAGWRRAYRISIEGSSTEALCSSVNTATAAKLRTMAPVYLNKIPQIIRRFLMQGLAPGNLTTTSSRFTDLTRAIKELESQESDFVSTQLALKAAQAVFIESGQGCGSMSSLDIEGDFSQQLVEWTIRHDFFAPAREGIALGNKRSTSQQQEWERGILSTLAPDSRKMLKPVLRSAEGSIKAPRRTTPQRRMTIEELNKGLTVIEV